MENISNSTFSKLSQLVNSYPVFKANQVLMAEQLNDIHTYLDRQHRLSRVRLSGMGIVCGLDIAYDEVGSTISITKGCAITSDGDLIFYDQDMKFTYFKDYPSIYSYPDSGDNQISLLELLTTDTTNAIPISEKQSILKDMVLMLYLESHTGDETCTGSDCERKGQIRQDVLKAVLINKSGLQDVLEKIWTFCKLKESFFLSQEDGSPPKPVLAKLESLKERKICMENAFWKAVQDRLGKDQTTTYKDFILKHLEIFYDTRIRPVHQYYFRLEDFPMERALLSRKSTKDLSIYEDFITKTINPLSEVLQKSYAICKPLLEEIYEADPTEAWKNKLNKLTNAIESGIQYRYDFLKDIVDTYSEFKELLFEDNVSCVPDPYAFPKHIILGCVIEDAESSQGSTQLPDATGPEKDTPSPDDAQATKDIQLQEDAQPPEEPQPSEELCDPCQRYQFYESPILNNKLEKLKKAQFLHRRLDYLIKTFEDPSADGSREIKITPSKYYDQPLSSRAIPYYYNIVEDDPLHENWNYELSLRQKNDSIYSYNADKFHGECEPLRSCISDYPFFRIEGHLGKDFNGARKELNRQIAKYDLPIKVLPLKLSSGRFARFLKEHPGMEHLAGVERGGTFILVYSSDDKVVADFALPYNAEVYTKIDELNRKYRLIPAVVILGVLLWILTFFILKGFFL